MVENLLVGNWIDLGNVLIECLKEANFPLVAAFWIYTEESGDWRLILASPLVDEKGPMNAARKVDKVIRSKPQLRPFIFADMSVKSPQNDLVRALRAVRPYLKEEKGIMVSGRPVDGHFIEHAYVYSLKSSTRPNSSAKPRRRAGTRRATRKSRAA
jgi:hypothetical protein